MCWTGSRIVSLLLAWLLVSAALPVAARDAQFSASVPVTDRTDTARATAVRQALGEVLVRLSGDRAVLGQAGSAALMAKASRYLQQYQYEGDEAAGALMLRAGFDGAALEKAMREQGLPLLGHTRPPVLIWLAVDDGSRRYMLGADKADAVYTELSAAADRSGLALVLPLYDLQDQAQLGYSDVAGGVLEKVLPASQRYATQAVLVGQLQRRDAQWSSRWRLHSPSGNSDWQTGTADLSATLDQGLGQMTDRLTPRATTAPSYAAQGAYRLPLRVEGVASLADYARVSDYLTGLGALRSLELVSVQSQRLDFLLDVQGGAVALEQSLALGGFLVHAPVADGSGMQTYRLRP